MDNNPEPNKDLENAANAMNEAAEATDKPINEETSAAMDALLNEEENKEAAPAEEKPAEEAPAEAPAPVEAAPVAEPTPAADPIVEATPVATATEAPKADKKSKKGLIIGCAVGVVALAGGGLGVAYAISNSPENVALSAISNFLSSKTMGVSGTFDLTASSEDSAISNAKITLKNNKNASGESDTSATIKVTYNNKDYTIELGSVVLKDYTIYIKIDGLKEAVKTAVKEFGGATLSDYAELYEDLISEVVGEIEGTWWKISIPELVDEVEMIDESQKSKIKEVYNCLVDTADKASQKNDDYAKIYKENAFITIKKHEGSEQYSGKGTAYDLSFDAGKLTNFANAMTDEVDSLGLEDCMNKVNDINGVSGSYEKTEVKKEDVEKAIENLPAMVVTIESGFFNHNITGFYTTFDMDGEYTGKIDLNFNKDAGTVAAPSDAKPVTDLYDNVVEAYENWQLTSTCKVMKTQYQSYYNMYCDPATNKIKPEYKSLFETNSSIDI